MGISIRLAKKGIEAVELPPKEKPVLTDTEEHERALNKLVAEFDNIPASIRAAEGAGEYDEADRLAAVWRGLPQRINTEIAYLREVLPASLPHFEDEAKAATEEAVRLRHYLRDKLDAQLLKLKLERADVNQAWMVANRHARLAASRIEQINDGLGKLRAIERRVNRTH